MKSYGPPHHVYEVSLPRANILIRIDTTLSINTNVDIHMHAKQAHPHDSPCRYLGEECCKYIVNITIWR